MAHHQTKMPKIVHAIKYNDLSISVSSQFTYSVWNLKHNTDTLAGIEERHTKIFNSSESLSFSFLYQSCLE